MLFWESSAWKISGEKSMTRVNVRLYCRRSLRRCSVKKKLFIRILQNSQKNTNALVSFLIKPRALHWKRDSGASCFHVSFEKFFRSLFHRTPSGDCSYYYIRSCWLTTSFVMFRSSHQRCSINIFCLSLSPLSSCVWQYN